MCSIESFVSKHDYAGRAIGGMYRFESFLGQGGFGEVWRGTSLRNGSEVAIKLLPAAVAKNSKTLEMLQHECDMLKSLAHPNICLILDFIHDDNTGSALVTELVKGTDIYKASADVDCTPLMIQLLQALSYLHGKGVYHFDIKPGNVLVSSGVVKLIDFGLASFKALEKVAGTPSYMAPEIFLQDTANMKGWTDLYAVGVLWYYCLTRTNPFRSTTLEVAKEKHFDERRPDKPKSQFGDIIMKLMARDYDKRFKSADEVLNQLQIVLGEKFELTDETAHSYAKASGDFIGREEYTDRLATWMQAATAIMRPNFVAVVGESGMGKTRLLRELKFKAQEEKLRVVAIGSASEITTETLSPLADAMAESGTRTVVLLDDFDQWQAEAQAQSLARMLQIIRDHPHVPSSILCIVSVSNRKRLLDDFEIRQILPFSRAEVGRFLDAIVKTPHDVREKLVDELMQHSNGNPGMITHILSEITRRGQLISASGRWDETLFEDITIDIPENSISQVKSDEISADELLETCRSDRLSGHSLRAFERIAQWISDAKQQSPVALLIEAAECALACSRANEALQLIDRSAILGDPALLFWKGILLTAQRRMGDARAILQEAQEMAKRSRDSILEIRISNQLARCDQLEGNIDVAIAAYRATEARARGLSDKQRKEILNNELGYALLMKGAYKEALPILEVHAKCCEAAGHVRRHLNAIAQTGDCFMKLGNVQKASDAYLQVITRARSDQQIDILSHACNQLSKLQFENNLLDEALVTMKHAIAINYMIGDLSSAAININNLGLCQLRAGLNGDAKNNLEVAKVFLERCPDAVQRSLVPCLIGLAELAKQGHEPKTGKDCLSRAADLAKQHHIYAEYQDTIQTTLTEIENM